MFLKIERDQYGFQKTTVYDGNMKLISEQVSQTNQALATGYQILNSDIKLDKKRKIVQVRNSTFYIPNYKKDLIQGCILDGNYFDIMNLDKMGKFLNKDSVVLDIGANIGNHTLYFANECHVKKIYSFEPITETFKILKKNIKLNNLEDRVTIQNVGLSNENTTGAIASFDEYNIGGTRLKHDNDGDIKLITVDSLNIKEKIDFIKIDVEAMDDKVVLGAAETIRKNLPVIAIESFAEEWEITKPFLEKLGYKVEEELSCCEYILTPKKRKAKSKAL